MTDFTYVENVAHAHICAEKALSSRGSHVCGKVWIFSYLYSMFPFDVVNIFTDSAMPCIVGLFHH